MFRPHDCKSYWLFRDGLSDCDDFGQGYLVCLFSSSGIKKGTKLIIHLDELSHLVRLPGRTKADTKRPMHCASGAKMLVTGNSKCLFKPVLTKINKEFPIETTQNRSKLDLGKHDSLFGCVKNEDLRPCGLKQRPNSLKCFSLLYLIL